MELQRCSACGAWRYPPAGVCPQCHSFEFCWERVSGRATLYTFSVIRRPATPAWADAVPYTYGIVALDEGPMMPSNVVAEPDAIAIGMRLRVVYHDVTPEVTLPRFEPAAGAP
jgi:uncharacterized OB-fold protein